MVNQTSPIYNYFKDILLIKSEKYGQITPEQQIENLYQQFSDQLINKFESQLTGQQQNKLAEITKNNPTYDTVMDFFMKNIPMFESKIMTFLVEFKKDYLHKF